ncbi:MAG: Ig-like domain-containing protein [Candidatus Zixiibacteriota bacterium]
MLGFGISATNADGPLPGLSSSVLPSGATFTDNGDGSGTFDWTPDFTQAGAFDVTFFATDDSLAVDSEVVTITVVEAGNQIPVLAAIGGQFTTEGIALSFGLSGSDPDGSIPSFSTSTLPVGALFSDNGDGSATFNWTPGFTQSGSYFVIFYVSDGFVSDSEVVSITVNEAGNQSPVLAAIGSQSTSEGINLAFSISASDPDSVIAALSTSPLPSGATFIDNGDGSGSFDWTPAFVQSGSYNITFYASDGAAIDSEIVAVTVVEAGNQTPLLASIGSQSITEGALLSLTVSAIDADSTIPTFSTSPLPSGAVFVDNGDGTGSFDWTPTFTQGGGYLVIFYANDGLASDSEIVAITVNEAGNQAPVLASIGAQNVVEGLTLNVSVSASDADGTIPSLTTSSLPGGASFIDNGNGSGSLSWTPDFIQAGGYQVTFYASDGVQIDSELVTITVVEAGNQTPVLSAIGAQTVLEGSTLSFGVSSSDADSTNPVLTTSTLPSGALFTDNGDGSGNFNWTPDFVQAGTYIVTFYAADGVASDSEQVTITVGEAGNQTPVLSAIGSQNTTEGILLTFAASASDADGTVPTLSSSTLPALAAFTDNGDGTGSFSWTPDFTQAGNYTITFYAFDGVASDSEVVSVTVGESGNQSPLLATIGSQIVTENINLAFAVTASDPDGSIPALSTTTLPVGATFSDNGDGSGNFSWTPDFTQSGTYNITFYASDGVLLDSEVVSITVLESGNQIPILAAIGSQSTGEGTLLSFGLSALDPDSTIPSLSSSTLPLGASFVDNGDGSASFDWTPSFVQAGSYSVTFFATDGVLVDSEVVAITVNEAGNQAPVLASIGPRATTEGINLNFSVSASDADATTPSLTTSALPSGANFVDNGDGTGSFDWTPNFIQSGTYNVTFYAGDGLASDSEVVTITVNEVGNQAPVLATIGAQSTTENINLTFGVSSTDADGTTPALSASGLPAGASFTDNGDGSGNFGWTPDFTAGGIYNVTFFATDGTLNDSEVVQITVIEAGNQTPVLATIGAQSTTEGVALNVVVSASDVDATIPVLSSSTLPAGASFSDNGDGTGSFDWTPNFIQSGTYNVTFFAFDGVATDSEVVVITVIDGGNQSPLLVAIGPRATSEGMNLNFGLSASDPDSTIPTLSSSTLPGGAIFTDNGDGSGSFDWTPDFTQGGTYNVTFFASDGFATDSEVVTISVNEAGNQMPVLATIGSQSATEGILLSVALSSSDPDGTVAALSTSALPSGAAFADNGDGSGSFDWTPDFTQSGSYFVIFYATDGIATDSEVVSITVSEAGNQPPVLAAIGAQSVSEGILLNVGVSASDADGTTPALTTSSLPAGALFSDNGNGTGSFDWTPDFVQSGIYSVTFYASDGLATDSEVVTITVGDAGNQSPTLATIGSQSTTEGVNLSFVASAIDPDGTIASLSSSPLPSGATFVDNGDGSATFDWTPLFAQSGTYNVTFYASDGFATDSEVVLIAVVEAGNQTPLLATIAPQTTSENVPLAFTVSAADPDSTTPSLSASGLPAGAGFSDNGDGSASFNWTPTFTQAGSYSMTVFASDGVLVDSQQVSITVLESGNQVPVLAAIGAQVTTENVQLLFGLSASDADGTTPILSSSALPAGAVFNDNGDGTGSFDWTPTFVQAGTYNVTFFASDGLATDSEVVSITVIDGGNQAPVLAAIGSRNTTEGILLTFAASASDPDGTIPTLNTSTLPGGATFTDNGDGTGSFDWTPAFTQSGTYNVTFFASDGLATDSEVVTISVNESGNQPPVLAAIGSKNTLEGSLLSFTASASDPDGTIPVLSSSSLPVGASFTNNGDGTGSFSWTPDFTQSGTYNITFYASDGVAVDSELVQITVNGAGNQPPVLAAIGAQSTSEGVNLAFAVSSSDPDSTVAILTTSTLPVGASFTDNLDGTGSFDWTPQFVQSGTYNITFYAGDGLATDSEVVVITVNDAGNQSPVLAAIGLQNTTEGTPLTFAVSALDPDSTIPILTTSTLPGGALFTDNLDGTGSFGWTPNFIQSGTYAVTFFASDGLASDSEIVTITVGEAGNQAPVLATIGPKSSLEGINLNFAVSATDADGVNPALSSSILPNGASFTDNGDGTGSFDWTPGFTQSGAYFVSFYATDGSATDSEVVSITINEAGNQPPVLASIGPQLVNEGANLAFGLSAVDPDSTTPSFSSSALPAGATFSDNGDGSASFDWTPTFIQGGIYSVTFYASDGLVTDSEVVSITVNDAGNQSPILAAIGSQTVAEGATLSFGLSAIDPDSTIPALSTTTLPLGALFSDNGDGTGSFDWTPDFTQSGTYIVTFYASDGTAIDSEVVIISVNEAGNQSPVLSAIGSQSTTEGINLNFVVTALDPDSTVPSLTSSTLPLGAAYVDNGDGTAGFNWTPGFTQSGLVSITFYASDGVLIDSEIVSIIVAEAGNQTPVLSPIGPQTIAEGSNLSFGLSASDADNTTPSLTTSLLPGGASFTDIGNGTGSFNWMPDFTQAGLYNITFYASDGVATDSEVVIVTVTEAGNQPPVLAAIGSQTTTEGVALAISLSASDADSTIPVLTSSTLPSGATFVDNGDGSASFDWTPTFVQAGGYSVTFYANDGLATDSEVVSITVIDGGNQTPVLAAIGSQSTSEGILLSVAVSASDADGTTPLLSAAPLPSGALFVDNGDGTGSFDWTPGFTQGGIYTVTFYASDGTASDSEVVTISVNEAGNQPPVLAAIGPQNVVEGNTLSFALTSSDPDGINPILSSSALPTGAAFVDNGDGSGSFSWTPGFIDAGIYSVTFYATDGFLIDSEVVAITVVDAGNQPPVLALIGAQTTAENVNLNFALSASDADTTTPSFAAVNMPLGASLVDNGDGTAAFDWLPAFTQAGVYSITFIASDGLLADSEIVAITVTEAGNQSPSLALIGAQSVIENSLLSIAVSASDPDSTIAVLTTSTLPSGAVFTDNLNGSGAFDWTPDFSQQGVYSVTFYASDGLLVDSEVVQITVNDAGNQSPLLAAIGAQSVNENVLLSFAVSAVDPDSTIAVLSTSPLPTGATFTDNTDGSGSFDWTPGFAQQGVYNITFYASDGTLIDSEIVAITVIDAGNQPPVLTAIGAQATPENVNLNFAVTASDPDGTTAVLSTTALPTGASFTDNTDGTGTFDWTPDFTQQGVYSVTFYASDGVFTDSEVVIITVTGTNQIPVANAGIDQFDMPAGNPVQLDGTASFDPDGSIITYSWVQVGGSAVTLFLATDSMPTFTPSVVDTYLFELTVTDGADISSPDTVAVAVISGAPPLPVVDLSIQIVGDAVQLGWSAVTLDTSGLPAILNRYVIYRGTSAYFTPTALDSIGSTDTLSLSFVDNDLGAANVVGDTTTQYFYTVQAVNFLENRSALSNRVGEYDYGLTVTATTNYSLVGVPFTNSGIVDADGLIAAIGASNVLTVNNFVAASQSFQSRFAAGFGTNFTVAAGGVYQINAAADTIFSVAGNVPDSGTISYSIATTGTTDFSFVMIPFELEGNFSVAQDIINAVPGLLNTVNNFVAGSQSYESRFAAGFGTNFVVKAGRPYQANAAATGTFPGP